MIIRLAEPGDAATISRYDRHIAPEELQNLIRLGRVSIAEDEGNFLGWLRWNLFWDNTPFLNMLYLLDGYRGMGHGRAMMTAWERQMAALGYGWVMTSTASDEYAQHFYQKLGYRAIGGFAPMGESYELIFQKEL